MPVTCHSTSPLNYFGLPGLNVGAAVFTGKAAQAAGTGWRFACDLVGRSRPLDTRQVRSSALYAHGAISNVRTPTWQIQLANPIPSAFYGYYLQAAYGAWNTATTV